jgi:DNA-binding SARP family transcriptional activator
MGGRALEFSVLGRIEAVVGGRPVDLGGRLPRATLASLLLDANRVVPTDRLIDRLWGESPPRGAAGTLQVYLSNLRRAFEPDRPPRTPSSVLVTQAPGYVLRVEPEAFDVVRFERLVAEGSALLGQGRHGPARDTLVQALAIWGGTPYADLAGQEWLRAEVNRLAELRAAAVEDLAEARIGLGDDAPAAGELEQLVATEPLRERAWELLALALYRGGRQADALRALERLRRTLADELGLDPRPAVRKLEDDILRHAPELELAPATRAEAGEATEEDRYLEIWSDVGRHVVVLRADQVTIGRASSSGAQVADATVSRTHAVVEQAGTVWSIRDAGSANGTLVNGQPVGSESRPLLPGDEIGLGAARLFFRSRAADAAAKTVGVNAISRRQVTDGR